MKRTGIGFAVLAGCLFAATAAYSADLPASATSFAIARQEAPPVELARQIVVGGGFYYGGAPVYAYRPYYYSYRPYYAYAYRPYPYYAVRPYVYRPNYFYYRPYVYNYGPYVNRFYGGSYYGRPYYCF